MAPIKYIDVFPFSRTEKGLRFLLLRRASANSYPGIWQPVAGKVKPGETAWEAGLREFREETGFEPLHFYALDHISSYYLFRSNEIIQVPAFIAEVALIDPILSHEHDSFKWCDLDEGVAKASWEPYRVALRAIPQLLHSNAALELAKIP